MIKLHAVPLREAAQKCRVGKVEVGVNADLHADLDTVTKEFFGEGGGVVLGTFFARGRCARVCSHPGAIEVSVHGRCVALRGPVLAEERDEIVQRIARVRGVEEVESELAPHETAEGVPALQGASRPRRGRAVVPATKLLLGGASLTFGAAALARLRVLGFALGGLGALWAARSIRERGVLEGRLGPRRLLQEASERANEARSGRLGASA